MLRKLVGLRRRSTGAKSRGGSQHDDLGPGLDLEDSPVDMGLAALLQDEIAFLCKSVREYARSNGSEVRPVVRARSGVVLFVDISGFAKLGKALTSKLSATSAAEDFSRETMRTLGVWTQLCTSWGGDVVKYAGDALMCAWLLPIDAPSDAALLLELRALACRAALEMMLRQPGRNADVSMHAGIAMGQVQELFLTSVTGSLRWHLMAGPAVRDATALLDLAPRGEVAVAEASDFGATQAHWNFGADARARGSDARFASRVGVGPAQRPQSFMPGSTALPPSAGGAAAAGKVALPAGVPAAALERRAAVVGMAAAAAAGRGGGLPPAAVRAFIPPLLRGRLHGLGFRGGEMRWCAVMFVALPEMRLAQAKDEEKVLRAGLGALNDTFLRVSQTVHEANGELRDLLFDDKGCVFIAVFGAYRRLENCELWALRAATAVRRLRPKSAIGVSAGVCFAGLCGSNRRHDFVVMGHDVNQASRFMSAAKPGEIVVGDTICEAASAFHKFTERTVTKQKVGYTETYLGHVLGVKRTDRRRSTIQMNVKLSLFGRSVEQALIQNFVHTVETMPGAMALVTVEGDRGVGKTALAQWMRRALPWQSLFSYAHAMEMDNEYFVAGQLMERALDLPDSLADADLVARLDKLEAEHPELDRAALGIMMPHVAAVAQSGRAGRGTATPPKLVRTGSMQSFTTVPGNAAEPTEESAARHGQAVSQAIAALRVARGAATCLLVIIEDAVWMDAGSTALLLDLFRRKDEVGGVVFVLTFRGDSDTDTASHWFEVMDAAKRLVGLQTRVLLHSLNREHTGRLARRTFVTLGRDYGLPVGSPAGTADPSAVPAKLLEVSAPVEDLIFLKTEGLPEAVISKVRWLLEKRFVKLVGGNLVFASDNKRRQAELESPDSMLEVTLDKFDKLSEVQQAVLKVAACAGLDFDSKILFEAMRRETSNGFFKLESHEALVAHLLDLAAKGFLGRLDDDAKAAAAEAAARKVGSGKPRKGSKEDALRKASRGTQGRGTNGGMANKKERERMWYFRSNAVMQSILHLIPYDRRTQLQVSIEAARETIAQTVLRRIDDMLGAV